jgi:hypothetical protein
MLPKQKYSSNTHILYIDSQRAKTCKLKTIINMCYFKYLDKK